MYPLRKDFFKKKISKKNFFKFTLRKNFFASPNTDKFKNTK